MEFNVDPMPPGNTKILDMLEDLSSIENIGNFTYGSSDNSSEEMLSDDFTSDPSSPSINDIEYKYEQMNSALHFLDDYVLQPGFESKLSSQYSSSSTNYANSLNASYSSNASSICTDASFSSSLLAFSSSSCSALATHLSYPNMVPQAYIFGQQRTSNQINAPSSLVCSRNCNPKPVNCKATSYNNNKNNNFKYAYQVIDPTEINCTYKKYSGEHSHYSPHQYENNETYSNALNKITNQL